jgi:toxin ParE1/3/4
VRAAILDSLQNLVQFPHIGRRQSAEGVRKISVWKYNYLIYYSVDGDAEEIIILAVQHSAREREYSDN